MGLFDKIKNALFEEEYVEIEEKPKKVKKEPIRKDAEKERPIAKKVVLPEKKDIKIEELEEELLDEDFEIEPTKNQEEKEEFKVMDDDDFKVDEEVNYPSNEPKIVKVIDRDEPVKDEAKYYQGKRDKQPYGIDETRKVVLEYGRSSIDTNVSHGAYEKKEDRTHFKPSPIISPIYGILDKNYRKEDVVTKREVRLVSSYARENLSVDDVRKKAYGTLTDDITREIEEPEKEITFAVNEEENLLVDLSDEQDKPSVKEVTMGDALEYFEDLGLEYNVDYVDANKERTIGYRSDDENLKNNSVVDDKKIENEQIVNNKREEVNVDSDDNLFDLIDSMYKENE